jgi:hypothetical protein
MLVFPFGKPQAPTAITAENACLKHIHPPTTHQSLNWLAQNISDPVQEAHS